MNGWLLSHAGLAPALCPPRPTFEASLAALETECTAAPASITTPLPSHPLLKAGLVRGGDAPIGGVTWQDWDDEFEDTLPLPQLVGHTVNTRSTRSSGRSWCLDGAQTCYGVLTPDSPQVITA